MSNASPGSLDSVVIVGATSTLARAMAARFAALDHALVLAGRDTAELEVIAQDLRVRYARPCHVVHFDALDYGSHPGFVGQCAAALGGPPDGAVVCFGVLPVQEDAQEDFTVASRCLDTNYTGAMSVLERFAAVFEARGSGFLAAVSSVAGDRGRKSNYHYGAAKAALNVFLGGLQNRLHARGVSVTTVKPGFLDTKMTWGLDMPARLVTDPARAADIAVRAILKGRGVVYVPGYWRLIMGIICHIPAVVFKRLSL
jgi:short-subunit dehydrogenase